MAKGKVHHWKHGWIPVDAFARKVLSDREKNDPRGSASADDMKAYRAARSQSGSDDMKAYRDALAANRENPSQTRGIVGADQHANVADTSRRDRYAAHLAATQDARRVMEQRYRDNFNRNHGIFAIPHEAIGSRVKSQEPFTYDPSKGKLNHRFGLEGKAVAPALKAGTTVDIPAPDDATIKAAIERLAAEHPGEHIGGHFWVPTNSYRIGVIDPTGQRPSEQDTVNASPIMAEASRTKGFGRQNRPAWKG